MRFIQQLAVVVVTLLVVSLPAALYVSLPYQLQIRIVYNVNVSPINTWANLLNVTFMPIKAYSVGPCNNNAQPLYLPQGNAVSGEKQLNATVTMSVNLTLARDGIPVPNDQCKLRAVFNKVGEYDLVILPVIYSITPNTYSMTVFYSSLFNSTNAIEVTSYNSTLEIL